MEHRPQYNALCRRESAASPAGAGTAAAFTGGHQVFAAWESRSTARRISVNFGKLFNSRKDSGGIRMPNAECRILNEETVWSEVMSLLFLHSQFCILHSHAFPNSSD